MIGVASVDADDSSVKISTGLENPREGSFCFIEEILLRRLELDALIRSKVSIRAGMIGFPARRCGSSASVSDEERGFEVKSLALVKI